MRETFFAILLVCNSLMAAVCFGVGAATADAMGFVLAAINLCSAALCYQVLSEAR